MTNIPVGSSRLKNLGLEDDGLLLMPITAGGSASSQTSTDVAVRRGPDGLTLSSDVVDTIDAGDGAPPTGNGTLQQLADYLRVGYWVDTGRAARAWAGGNVTINLQDLTATERGYALTAMALWSGVANINFTEVNSGGQIVMLNNGSGIASTNTTVSGATLTAATITISSDWSGVDYMRQTYMHEIGHAIGLGHQGPYNNSATYPNDANWFNDSWRVSVMSYFSQSEAGTGTYAFVLRPGAADIRALQNIYGSEAAFAADTVWGVTGADQSFTIYDTGGTDVLNANGYAGSQTFDLRSGIDFASSLFGETNNISIWTSTVVENASGGSGSDTFIGNSSNNIMNGNAGTDTARLLGNRSAFTFVETNNYSVTGTGQGTDTLISIERFQFDDMLVVDDAIGGTNTTDTIAVDNFRTGDIQFLGDRDWYRVTLTGGTNYVFDLRGSPTGNGTLTDPLLRLYNAAGTQVASNDDGGQGFESQLAVRVGATGTYYLGAGRFSDSGFGTYRLETEALEGNTRWQDPILELGSFGRNAGAGGWSSQNQLPRMVGDFNGDSVKDIIGFGDSRVYVALGSNGNFFTPVGSLESFGPSAGGWTNQDQYTRTVGDVNGDGRDDIVGFGATNVYISLSTGGTSFALPYADLASFGPVAGGWTSNNTAPRMLADVNGDGRDDIVGFGSSGVYVATAKTVGTPGFNLPTLASNLFGSDASAGGWSSYNTFPRTMADVNGDGRADIIGFGGASTFVALGQANGTFGAAFAAVNSFGFDPAGGGWASFDRYPRMVQDINFDGRADVVGFGGSNVYYALGQANGSFSSITTQDIASFGYDASAGSWTSYDMFPRLLGDLTGDGRPEILGLGGDGVYVSRDLDFINV